MDSGYIRCVDESSLTNFKGFYVDSARIQCLIPTFNQSIQLILTVIFSKTNNDPPSGVNTRVKFDVFRLEPAPVSCIMEDDLFSVVCNYNGTVASVSDTDADNCSLYLADNSDGAKWNEQVGDAECYLIDGDSLLVELGVDASLKHGDKIALKGGGVIARGEALTKPRTGNEEFIVQGPAKPPVPGVEIEGGDNYGRLKF